MPEVAAGLHVRIGARKSALARAQAEYVAGLLAAQGATVEMVGVVTTGDTDRRHLTQIGGTGVFATQVRDQLREGHADVAVHSLKDLPIAPAPGLAVAAIPEREDPRDVLVGTHLDRLASGMRVGTGSPRRVVQLRQLFAARGLDIEIVPIRGNVGTRIDLARSGTVDAVVLAMAGLSRLGLVAQDEGEWMVEDQAAQPLDLGLVLPAAGQAALAVEIREDADPRLWEAMAAIDHLPSRVETTTERHFLGTLEAGCLAPVGVHAVVDPVATGAANLTMRAVAGQMIESASKAETGTPLEAIEGSTVYEAADPTHAVAAAHDLGERLARQILLRLPAGRRWE